MDGGNRGFEPALSSVLHVAPGQPFGGLQNLVVQLAMAQRRKGRKVSILWVGSSDHAVSISERAGLPFSVVSGSLRDKFHALRAALKNSSCKILHLHMAPPWIALLRPEKVGLMCVHLHEQYFAPKSPKARVASILEEHIMSKADTNIAISSWIRSRWAVRFPTLPIDLVLNGTPEQTDKAYIRQHGPVERPLVGFASRLAVDKGVREFADFALAMHALMPRAQFVVAGEGSERAVLEMKLRSLIEAKALRFLGHVRDMPGFWRALDLAVFTAREEPFGLRMIEPVAHGVPVVAYRTGAGSDEVADLCAGVATVPYGLVDELARLARGVLEDDTLRTKMSLAGLLDVRNNFSMDAMADSIEAVYHTAMIRRFRKT